METVFPDAALGRYGIPTALRVGAYFNSFFCFLFPAHLQHSKTPKTFSVVAKNVLAIPATQDCSRIMDTSPSA